MTALFLIIATMISIHAEGKVKSSPCTRQCAPSEIQEVSILFLAEDVDNIFRRNPARAFHKVAPGSRDLEMKVGDLATLPKYLTSLASSCMRVKRLDIFSHGAPGEPVFSSNSSIPSLTADGLYIFEGLDCVMSPKAEIHFAGCNIGRGCAGEDLMMGVAQALLTKGGQVHAATNFVATIPGARIEPGSIWDKQVLVVGAGLKSARWKNSPASYEQCQQAVETVINDIERTRAQHLTCVQPNLIDQDPLLHSKAMNALILDDSILARAHKLRARYESLRQDHTNRTAFGLTSEGVLLASERVSVLFLPDLQEQIGPCTACAGNCHPRNGDACLIGTKTGPESNLPIKFLDSWINENR